MREYICRGSDGETRRVNADGPVVAVMDFASKLWESGIWVDQKVVVTEEGSLVGWLFVVHHEPHFIVKKLCDVVGSDFQDESEGENDASR